jgi:hypothetical protein
VGWERVGCGKGGRFGQGGRWRRDLSVYLGERLVFEGVAGFGLENGRQTRGVVWNRQIVSGSVCIHELVLE